MKSLALALAVAIAPLPLAAFDISAMSDGERTEFRAEIRNYLLENPEVLMEAIAVLEQRKTEAQAQDDVALVNANAEDLFNDPSSWVGGNPDGDITIVEFLDYRCGYCRKAHPEVAELIKSDGNIRVIVKELPILGEQSVLASRFALSVLQNEGDAAYKTVNDQLMALRAEITPESLETLSEKLGLDTSAVMSGMVAPSVDAVIAENRALAQRLQINGTPSFVFKDQMLRGYVPLGTMRSIVAELRQ